MTDAAGTAARVSYQEGQALTAADLITEQSYLIGMRQRHAATSHGWGIVEGLGLSLQGATVSVLPGMALDGYGNQLIVPEVVQVSTGQLQRDEVSVWLVYALELAGNPQNRRREVTLVRFTCGAEQPRDPPMDGADWPVFLGILRRAGGNYTVDPDRRPYVSLAGETVTAASGRALMRCGADFAVALPVPKADPVAFTDKLRIDASGKTRILADAIFTGDLQVKPNPDVTPPGKAGVGFDVAIAPPEKATPWRIYRAKIEPKDLPPVNELVIELLGAQEKEDPDGLRSAMGSAVNGRFQAALTVTSGGDVTVEGVLRVAGRIIESPISADPTDPRFLVALVNASNGAISDGAPGPLGVQVEANPAQSVDTPVLYTLIFTNAGPGPVQVIDVQEFATLNGKLVPSQDQPIPAFQLQAVETRAGRRSIAVDSAGNLAIGVRVLGVGPDGMPLSAKHAVQIQVMESTK